MNYVLGVAALLGLSALVNLVCREVLYKRGFRDGRVEGFDAGYRVGRIDADNWWLDAEQQVDRARQKIWREHSE